VVRRQPVLPAPELVLGCTPSSRCRESSREGPFGLPRSPEHKIRKDLETVLDTVSASIRRTETKGTEFPLKRLRSQVVSAMRAETITTSVVRNSERTRNGFLLKENNPFWDTAPRGAYKKARKLSSFINFLILNYSGQNIVRRLTRFTTYMWFLSFKDFKGSLAAIRGLITRGGSESRLKVKSETLEHLRMLTRTPAFGRVNPSALDGKCRITGCVEKRLSTCVDLTRIARKCVEHTKHLRC